MNVNATTTKIATLWKDGNNAQAQAATLARQKFSRAKAALNRLLAKAWGKKGGKRKATSAKDRVHAIAKMLSRLTATQFKRAVAEAKEIRAE